MWCASVHWSYYSFHCSNSPIFVWWECLQLSCLVFLTHCSFIFLCFLVYKGAAGFALRLSYPSFRNSHFIKKLWFLLVGSDEKPPLSLQGCSLIGDISYWPIILGLKLFRYLVISLGPMLNSGTTSKGQKIMCEQ